MQTNSPLQQKVRRMTKAEKAAYTAEKIAAAIAAEDAYRAEFKRRQARDSELLAAGATQAELWDEIDSWYR